MSIKDDLRPNSKNRVIDLVQAAGIDISDWANYARGAKWAAANPKYCYEWSFIQPGQVVVLNLWHANLREQEQTISVSINMREQAKRIKRIRAKPIWIKRALNMDDAIRQAYEEQLIVRVIINEGEMRRALSPNTKASVVKQRALDPVPWAVTSYNASTGDASLVRGGIALVPVDQFDFDSTETPAPQKVAISGNVFVRDPAIRLAALARANGHCEFCGQPGFTTSTGQIFLETHHIIPLSQGGRDTITNVAAVCANHHREAHFGAQADLIRKRLLDVATLNQRKHGA